MNTSARALLVIALLTGCAGPGAADRGTAAAGHPTGLQASQPAGGVEPAGQADAAAQRAPELAGDGETASGAAAAAADVPGADAHALIDVPPGAERHGVFVGLPPARVGLPSDFVAPAFPEDAKALHKGMVVGSWTPDDPAVFEQAWIDEPLLVQAFTRWRAGRRTWRGMTFNAPMVSVDVLMQDRSGPAVAYLMSLVQRRPDDPATLEIPADAQAVLHIKHRGRLAAWFDGRPIIDAPAPPPGEVGLVQVPVVLTHGYDVLLLKLGRGAPELGDSMDVEVRLSDLDGRPLPNQDWNTMRTSDGPNDLNELGLTQGEQS